MLRTHQLAVFPSASWSRPGELWSLLSHSWSAIDYVSEPMCITVLCGTSLRWGNVCSALPWGYDFLLCFPPSFMMAVGKCTVADYHPCSGEKVLVFPLCPSSLRLLLKLFEWRAKDGRRLKKRKRKSPEWVFHFLNSPWCVCLHLMKWCWKAQSIHTSHIFMHWHIGPAKQRLRGRGLWNDNARSSSSRHRHPLLLIRNVLTNRGRP